MIKTVGVVGAGTMGSGIAQVFAQADYSVQLVDVARPMLDAARRNIEKSLGKFLEKGKLTAAARDAALARLSTATSLDSLADADYIVEAIVEDVEAKQSLFAGLDASRKHRPSWRQTLPQFQSPVLEPRPNTPNECSACTS